MVLIISGVIQNCWGQDSFRGVYLDNQGKMIMGKSGSRIHLDQSADSILIDWMTKGYISASLDSVYVQDDSLVFQYFKGEQYKWGQLKFERSDNLSKKVRPEFLNNTPISFKDLGDMMNGIITKYENEGYPFARVSLEQLSFNEGVINARLKVFPNNLVLYDSIFVKGDAVISRAYLSNVLDIKKGDRYSESTIRSLEKKLREIAFISSTSPPQFVFKEGKVDTYLYLKPKKANRFNGVLGFLPNSNSGKTNFTGEIDLSLVNTFKAGEQLFFEWRRIQENVQELTASASVPYLLNTPFGIEGQIEIFRRDTIFLEVQNQVGIIYNFGAGDLFRAYYKSYNSDNLGNDFEGNPQGGTNYDSYGLGLVFSDLDYRFNPRKGYNLNIKGDVGQKFFKSNTFADSIATGIPEKSTIYTMGGTIEYFIPSGKRSTVLLSVTGSAKLNRFLISNELYRYGGINSLRGFDENGLNASSYVYFTGEYRLLTDLNSNLFLFFNAGITEKDLIFSYEKDAPYGFGVGANFATNAGVFSISYALGSEQGNAVSLKQAKVHFGFKSLF